MQRTISYSTVFSAIVTVMAGVLVTAGWTASAQCSLKRTGNPAACRIAAGADAKAGKKAQTTCPVMGGKIDKKYYADYKGKRVYFCCPGCIAKFKADPEKYLKKLDAAGVTPDAVCPKCGKVKGSPQCCK